MFSSEEPIADTSKSSASTLGIISTKVFKVSMVGDAKSFHGLATGVIRGKGLKQGVFLALR
jgi:hypothetical protein